MSATETNLWDYVVTYGGPSLFMTAVFLLVLPLAWFLFVRRRFRRWPSRLAAMLTIWIVAWFVAYGDVLLIAREAKQACETEAGLKVYRTAVAAGFAGATNIEYWAKQGFEFVEYQHRSGAIFRYTSGRDPIPLVSPKDMRSRFLYEYLGWGMPNDKGGFESNRQVVRELATGEILGELVTLAMRYGWLDRPISSATGAQHLYCQGGVPVPYEALPQDSRALIFAVLIPTNRE